MAWRGWGMVGVLVWHGMVGVWHDMVGVWYGMSW